MTNHDAGSVVSGSIRPAEPGPEARRLGVFIGRWVTDGHLLDEAGEPPGKIVASDVYEWVPGGFFVIQPAHPDRGGRRRRRRSELMEGHHERRSEEGSWVPSMEVVLSKVG